jgi:hypothetical protein
MCPNWSLLGTFPSENLCAFLLSFMYTTRFAELLIFLNLIAIVTEVFGEK